MFNEKLIEHIVFQLTAMHSQIEVLTDLQDSLLKEKMIIGVFVLKIL